VFNTNDIYNEAVKDAIINEEEKEDNKLKMVYKIVLPLLLIGLSFVAFYYYNNIKIDQSLVIKTEESFS